MCSQGYASSLAAASLQDIGLVNATDLAGGFLAWARAGLPCQPGTAPRRRRAAGRRRSQQGELGRGLAGGRRGTGLVPAGGGRAAAE